jgi:transcriptional regulator with XRE-family HTH domain
MLNEKLRNLRLEVGKQQNQVADEIGIKRTTYSNYEKGIREPNAETLILISRYFGVTVDYLLDVKDNIQNNSLTNLEMQYVNKCRKIDSCGIEMIRYIIDHEYNRCQSQKQV